MFTFPSIRPQSSFHDPTETSSCSFFFILTECLFLMLLGPNIFPYSFICLMWAFMSFPVYRFFNHLILSHVQRIMKPFKCMMKNILKLLMEWIPSHLYLSSLSDPILRYVFLASYQKQVSIKNTFQNDQNLNMWRGVSVQCSRCRACVPRCEV